MPDANDKFDDYEQIRYSVMTMPENIFLRDNSTGKVRRFSDDTEILETAKYESSLEALFEYLEQPEWSEYESLETKDGHTIFRDDGFYITEWISAENPWDLEEMV